MNIRTTQRILSGFLALFVVAVGVFMPVSLVFQGGVSGTNNRIAASPLVAHAQASFSDQAAYETPQFETICPDSLVGVGCWVVHGATKGLFKITSLLASASGGLFDYMLWFTIQSSTYSQSEFIEVGWGVVRDFANIVFIIALIWAAAAIMLSGAVNIGNGRKMLAMVIVSALLVNFSLFFAQVVVDASHILARTFYNRITADVVVEQDDAFGQQGAEQTQVSVALLSHVNPQKLILNEDLIKSTQFGWTMVITVYTFMTIINGFLIFLFLSMALLFVGRTVALMMGMIVAPLAFATLPTPLATKAKFVGFHNWANDLVKNAFMVPVFLFFLYLTVLFMSTTLTFVSESLGNPIGKTLGQQMIDIMIPMALVLGLLIGGKKAASGLASEIAGYVNKGVGMAAGVVAGTAFTVAGGVAVKGASIVAQGGKSAAGSLLRRGAAQTAKGNKITGAATKWLGKKVGSASTGLGKANLDLRTNKYTSKFVSGSLGFAGINNIGFGQGRYTSADDREKKRIDELKARNEEMVALMNRKNDSKEVEETNNLIQRQYEIDQVKSSQEYKDAEKKEKNEIKNLDREIKEEKETREALVEELRQIDKDIKAGKTTDENGKDLVSKKKGVESEMKTQNEVIKSMENTKTDKKKSLEDGSFFKGSGDFANTKKELDDAKEGLSSLEYNKERQEELRKTIATLAMKPYPSDDDTKKLENARAEKARVDEKILNSPNKAQLESRKKAAEKAIKDELAKDNADKAYVLWNAREEMKKSEDAIKSIKKDKKANERLIVKQELDWMQGGLDTVAKIIGSTIATATAGAVTGALTGTLGASLATGITAGAIARSATMYRNIGTKNKPIIWRENDVAAMQQLIRRSVTSDDK